MDSINLLLSSKKAMMTMVMLLAIFIMLFIDKMSVDQWMDYSKWLLGFYLSSEAVDSGLGKMGSNIAMLKSGSDASDLVDIAKASKPSKGKK